MKTAKTSAARTVVLVFFMVVALMVMAGMSMLLAAGKMSVTEVSVAGQQCYFTDKNFTLRWMHSVEKQWWEENYQRRDADFLLTTTYFQAFGAGTPSTEKVAPVSKPGYVGYQIDEPIPVLHWIVSRLTKGEILYGEHKLRIHEWAEDYSEVTITPRNYGVIEGVIARWNKEVCHEYHDQ